MKYKYLILVVLVGCFSCRQNECSIDYFKNSNWETVDSMLSYKVCAKSNQQLDPNASIQVEYLGFLEPGEEGVIRGPIDAYLPTSFSEIGFGKFKSSSLPDSGSFSKIRPLLKKNSDYIFKLDLTDEMLITLQRRLTVYFKPQTDSSDLQQWINGIAQQEFVDSISFISSSQAIDRFSQEQDTVWRRIIKENPLPASVDIFVKKNKFNTIYLDSLITVFMKNETVSDVSYPADISRITDRKPKIFFIRIKS
jgi:hypothetical protein